MEKEKLSFRTLEKYEAIKNTALSFLPSALARDEQSYPCPGYFTSQERDHSRH
jgi:hypothetical protein